jgi:uncharacterized protein YcfL
MNKRIRLAIVFFICFILTGCSLFKKDQTVSNSTAVVNKKERIVTIINDTNQVINEFHLYVGKGTELSEYKKNNIDENSFSIKIDKKYDSKKEFTFMLIDNYGMTYEKKVKVPLNKTTEIVIHENDNIKQKNDIWRKINKWFNGN